MRAISKFFEGIGNMWPFLPIKNSELYRGIASGDPIFLLKVLGVFLLALLAVTIVVNVRESRRNRKAPQPNWGKKSRRFSK